MTGLRIGRSAALSESGEPRPAGDAAARAWALEQLVTLAARAEASAEEALASGSPGLASGEPAAIGLVYAAAWTYRLAAEIRAEILRLLLPEWRA